MALNILNRGLRPLVWYYMLFKKNSTRFLLFISQPSNEQFTQNFYYLDCVWEKNNPLDIVQYQIWTDLDKILYCCFLIIAEVSPKFCCKYYFLMELN